MSDTPSADRPMPSPDEPGPPVGRPGATVDQPGPTAPTPTAPDPGAPATPLAPPAQRGGLDVADKALRSIATSAAAVPGTAPAGSLPSAKVTSAGARVAVAVEVALVWPQPAAQVAAAVRDAVRAALTTLGGVQVDAVHVTVAKVVAGTAVKRPVRHEPAGPGQPRPAPVEFERSGPVTVEPEQDDVRPDRTHHDHTEHDQAEQDEERTR